MKVTQWQLLPLDFSSGLWPTTAAVTEVVWYQWWDLKLISKDYINSQKITDLFNCMGAM